MPTSGSLTGSPHTRTRDPDDDTGNDRSLQNGPQSVWYGSHGVIYLPDTPNRECPLHRPPLPLPPGTPFPPVVRTLDSTLL